jgi:hypothetical protein
MMARSDDKRQQDDQRVHIERDTHYQVYGKHAWEVEYGERCPICDKRIDEFDFAYAEALSNI